MDYLKQLVGLILEHADLINLDLYICTICIDYLDMFVLTVNTIHRGETSFLIQLNNHLTPSIHSGRTFFLWDRPLCLSTVKTTYRSFSFSKHLKVMLNKFQGLSKRKLLHSNSAKKIFLKLYFHHNQLFYTAVDVECGVKVF